MRSLEKEIALLKATRTKSVLLLLLSAPFFFGQQTFAKDSFAMNSFAMNSFAMNSFATNSFWQTSNVSNQQRTISTQEQSLGAEFSGQSSSLSFQKAYSADTDLYVHYAHAHDERQWVLGTTVKNMSLSVMQGKAEDAFSLTGEYGGIDPYVFHAGLAQTLSFNGYAVDYDFNRFGHLQYGEATVQSDNLYDRKARYVEWSNKQLFARITGFQRDSTSIGHGLDAGFSFGRYGRKQIAWQSVSLDDDKSLQRIRFKVDQSKTKQYWVDFSKQRNALYQDSDDYRMMFTFKALLGNTKSWSNGYKDEVDAGTEEGEPRKAGNGWKRAVFIGTGVAAAASLSSSGSEDQDEVLRFSSQTEAAFNVLNRINPVSVQENREYGGYVYVNADGSYSFTKEIPGDNDSVTLPGLAFIIPAGSRGTATYHTHAAFDPRYDNENFSQADLRGDRALGLDGYLATPGGQFKYHNVRTDKVTTLGPIAN